MNEQPRPTQYDIGNLIGNVGGGNFSNTGNIAAGNIIIHPDPTTPLTFPLDNLPPANRHFSGRQALLARLRAAESATVAITQAIAGMGGVGKTQLALAYAHQRRADFDLIWWLNGSEAALLDGDLRQLGQILRLPLPANDAAAARQTVLTWLASGGKRWLLVYDNVDQLTPRELRPYLPAGTAGCQLLITSRSPHWQSVARVVDVNVFTPAEAVTFWRQRLGGADGERAGKKAAPTEDGDLAALATGLGHLPLALEQAAAYMAASQTDAASYWRLFQTRRQALWAQETAPDDYHATVATTWNIGFEQVQGVAGAADLLGLCSFLAPDDIPLDLLLVSFPAVERLQSSPLLDELSLAGAMLGLRRYALLDGTPASLTSHRLVQTVYRDQMGREVVQQQLATVIALLRASLPDGTRLHEWADGPRLLPHLIAAADLADSLGLASEPSAFLDNWTGYYLQFLGNYAAARPYYERALAICEKALGPEQHNEALLQATASSLNNLGALHRAMGNLAAARPYYERALAICEKALGPEHPDTASSLNNLGALLDSMGNLAAARPYYERALAICEKALGPEHPDTALSLNNLGYLLQAMGNLAAARPYYERALAICEKALGPEHPDTALSLNNLGYLLQAMGNLAAARPYYERALAICEKALGPEHPDTARSLNNLGALLQAMGNLAAARPYYERALAIREKALGPEHPDTALSLNNLGYLLQAMGNLAAARPYYERALAIREKALGPEHPDTALSLNNLGYLLQAMGNLAAARPYYERALAIREKALGPEHPDTALSLNNLGYLLQAMGNLAAARPYYERALAICEKALGPEHPDTARSLNNLGSLLDSLGDLAAARPYYERALAIREKALGPAHPDTASSLNNLAILAYYEGDMMEATRLMRRALAIWEQRLGPEHPDTQTARESLAVIEGKLSS